MDYWCLYCVQYKYVNDPTKIKLLCRLVKPFLVNIDLVEFFKSPFPFSDNIFCTYGWFC